MESFGLKSMFEFLNREKKSKFLSLAFLTLLFTAIGEGALAATFTSESDWQAAAGNTVLEDFESYSDGEQLSSLPALGIEFESLAGGGLPSIYESGFCCISPYGSKHLANFGADINPDNQDDDIVMNVLSGYTVTALGFWNGDGQSDVLAATFYDADDNMLGTIGALAGTFAGFTSDVAISRIVFSGITGDGYNHFDGLQTNASRSTPEPTATLGLLLLGGLGLVANKQRKS